MAAADGLRGMRPFDVDGDSSSVSVRWKAYIEEFDAYADCRNLFVTADSDENKAQRHALLMYTAGTHVRELFRTLPNTGGPKDLDACMKALTDHLVVPTNRIYQRHVFRKTAQMESETVAQYRAPAKGGCRM